MKKPTSSNNAILVLECPWELDSGDANRSSVLPFVEGVAKHAGSTEVFHANFYDYRSFKQALECLCKTRYANTTVYVAGHGSRIHIGGVKVQDVLFDIGQKSKKFNITGVLLGACFAGKNNFLMEAFLEGTGLRWCAGYSSAVEWLPGTLVDCSILSRMCEMDPEDAEGRDSLVEMLGDALAPFSQTYPIGSDDEEDDVSLRDCVQFVVQPAGQGWKARTVTDDVFASHLECQVDD